MQERLGLEGLTRHVLDQTLRQLEASGATGGYPAGRLLAVMTGGEAGQAEALAFLGRLREAGWKVALVLSKAAARLVDQDRLREELRLSRIIVDGDESSSSAIATLLREHQEIVVPVLTANTAAKLAAGIHDTLPAILIWHGLLAGKRVTAARNAADPHDPSFLGQIFHGTGRALNGGPDPGKPNAAVVKRMEENLKILASYGVRLVDVAELPGLFTGEPASPEEEDGTPRSPGVLKGIPAESSAASRKVITRAEVEALACKGAVAGAGGGGSAGKEIELVVEPGTIVTPLARDVARERGITIRIRPGKGGRDAGR
ncbi:MAG: flavoprotein [Syntrophothermus sp.]